MKGGKTEGERIADEIGMALNGGAWHGPSLTEVLSGLTWKDAIQRPIPAAHNIWELVLHMTAWTREVASRVRGADAKSPPEDWPAPRFGGGEPAWKSAKDDLAAAQNEIEAAVAALQAADLVRWIENREGTSCSVGTVIRGLLQHHTYHEGQIAILKRAAETAGT